MRKLTALFLLLFVFVNLDVFAAASDTSLLETKAEASEVLEKIPEVESLVTVLFLSLELGKRLYVLSSSPLSPLKIELPLLKLIQSTSNRSQAPPALS